MKQTAVEWLQEAISKKVNNELGPYFIDLFDNAKEMEKEQIMKAVDAGFDDGSNFIEDIKFTNAEQYYNETYKKD